MTFQNKLYFGAVKKGGHFVKLTGDYGFNLELSLGRILRVWQNLEMNKAEVVSGYIHNPFLPGVGREKEYASI